MQDMTERWTAYWTMAPRHGILRTGTRPFTGR